MLTRSRLIAIVAGVPLLATSAAAQVGFSIDWSRQIGDATNEWSPWLAPDGAGGFYMAANVTDGFHIVNPNGTVLLAHLGAQGQVLWTKRIRPGNLFYLGGIISLGPSGFYVAGGTAAPSPGPSVASLIRYDATGEQVWERTVHTEFMQGWECFPAADPKGNIIVAGMEVEPISPYRRDVYIRKYTPAGDQIWTRRFGTVGAAEYPTHIAATPDGGAYIVGRTEGSLPGFTNQGDYDSFLLRIDAAGNDVWIQQFGWAVEDTAHAVALAPDGGAYVAGSNGGSPPDDGYVTRFDPAGNRVWTLEFATPSIDAAVAIAVDPSGLVFAAGHTSGSQFGAKVGQRDVWLAAITDAGQVTLLEQFGSTGTDDPRSLVSTQSGKVVMGLTVGSDWAGPFGGIYDVAVAQFASNCRAENTTTAVPTLPGYGLPNGILNNDDFFYFLAQFASGSAAEADLTTSATPGSSGWGIPNGLVNNDDFFFYLGLFAAGC